MSLTETQICKSVLRRLATGETPSHLVPSPGDLLNRTDLDGLNATSSTDAYLYDQESQQQHQHSITVALSILSDSTSPGPDPLALQALGWAYGMGGGGGMGDWDGCHYVPGDIGATLRVLQDQVAFQLLDSILTDRPYSEVSETVTNATDELKEAWWIQKQQLEFGQGYNRAATRFCTVGSLPPYTKPYVPGGILWAPPVAGICVPSACTAAGLYELFDEEGVFANELLTLAEEDGFTSHEMGEPLPTMSRRFRYMLSLAQSMSAGKRFKMGVDCEGESGLRELDEEGYLSYGYYATVTLILVLVVCCILGTIATRIEAAKKKYSARHSNVEAESSSLQDFLDSWQRMHSDGGQVIPTTIFKVGSYVALRVLQPWHWFCVSCQLAGVSNSEKI